MNEIQKILLSILIFYNIKVTDEGWYYAITLKDDEVDLIMVFGKNVQDFKEIIEVLNEYYEGKENRDNPKD